MKGEAGVAVSLSVMILALECSWASAFMTRPIHLLAGYVAIVSKVYKRSGNKTTRSD